MPLFSRKSIVSPMKFKILFITFFLFISCASVSSAANLSVAGVRFKKDVKPLREIKREHVVAQSLDFSCGAAGLSTLLHYYLGDPTSEEDIINNLLNTMPLEKVIARRGFSMLDLKKFAQAKGYKVTGYKMDIDFLKELNKPVLVPITFRKYKHFVIVRGVIADRVFFADPAAGNMSMKISKFKNLWMDGIGLVVEKEKEENLDYALKIKENDLVIADHKMLRRIMGREISTNAYPQEF